MNLSRAAIDLKLVTSDYLNQILDEVGKRSDCAANKAREFLYMALKQMKKECRINNIPKMKKCPRNSEPVRIFTKAELKRFLDVAQKDPWYLEYLLCLFVGCRKGEVLGLQFEDFDQERQAVTIARQITYRVKFKTGTTVKESSGNFEKMTKTEFSQRTVYVPDIIWDELEKRKQQLQLDRNRYGAEFNKVGLISYTDKGLSRGTSSINNALNKICERNGIKHITVHSLRHTYATILLEQGYELGLVSSVLGHKNIHTTYEYYADILDENEEISEVLNELYELDLEEDT